MLAFLFLVFHPISSDYEASFKSIASLLSYSAEKNSPSLFTILADHEHYFVSSWGVSLLFSQKLRNSSLSFGYSHYFKTKETKEKDFLHLALAYRLRKKPELKIESRYGFALKDFIFFPGNPYATYKINSYHALGLFLFFSYPLKKIQPYLLPGISFALLQGEFIEDIFQNKIPYKKDYLQPKLKFGIKIFFFSASGGFELDGKSFAFSYHFR